MANEEMQTSILIKAKTDDNQIKKEVDKAGDVIQKENSKGRNKITIQADIDDAQKKFEKLSAEYKELKSKGATPIVLKAKAEEMRKANDEIVTLKKELKSVEGVTNSAGNAIQWLVAKFAGFAAITKILSFLINTFDDFQKAQKELVMATGATGDALRGLEKNLADVQGTVAQNSTEVAQAIGELNTRLGLTGEDLTEFTTKYMNFATVTGQDAKTAIADNVKMFNIWGVATNKQAEYLDKLAKAGQLTGVNVSNLTTQLQTNQAVLSEMGFTLDDSIALLSNFEQAGIEATDALAAMKVGVANLVDSGANPADALADIVDSIKNAKTEAEAMEIAFNTFGKRWGLAMFNAIRNGTLDVDKMADALKNAQGTIDDTYKHMETLGEFISRKWNGAVADFVQWNNEGFWAVKELAEITSQAVEPVTNFFDSWTNWITRRLKGEAERKYENGEISIMLNERGKEVDALKAKQEALQQQEQQAISLNKQYREQGELLNQTLAAYDAIKIDDTATREEFDKTRTAALNLSNQLKETLKAMIAFQSGVMVDAKAGGDMKAYAKALAAKWELVAELWRLETRINNISSDVNNKKKSGGGGGGGSKSSKATDPVKEAKEQLQQLRDLKIQEIQDSVDGEREKNEKLLEVYNWYKDELVKVEGKTNDELLKSAEQYVNDYYKKMQDASEKEQKATTDSIKKAEKYQDAIEKLGEKREDYKDSAIKNIREVNNELAELDKEFNQDIAGRYNEINEIIKDFERENGNSDWLKGLSVDMLRNRDSDKINEIPVKDAIEYLQALQEQEYLNERLNDQQKELANTLQEQTESERLINEYEQKRATLQEQKGIYEAVANQGSLDAIGKKAIELEGDVVKYYDATKDQYVEITDFKNQELARDLLNQQTKLETEYQQQETALQNELQLVQDHSKKVLDQWQSDTKAYKKELDNRVDAVRDYVASVQALLASVPDSYRAYGGELNKGVTMVGENWPEAIVRRNASYVQPRNAVQSYSTVNNNQSSFSINGMNINVSNIDEFLGELKNRLTYRN